ncbi:MAG TPA: response regulator transcription factor [bacterium]|nr:response regulator transcription factor [bacterium]HOX86406.1 response regulator transcription factor [bacterium]HPG45765.1 response regulator transcription factor [bacterium]HPM98008.1 response regulator transcription factor [bacterium]
MADSRIVIVDDHQLVRAGLRELLDTFQKIHVVGEAGDGLSAVKVAQEQQPDLVLLDISMPQMRGLEAIKEIKRVSPHSKILMLSMYEYPEYVQVSFQNGADGFLLKDAAVDELKTAIETIMAGKRFVSTALSDSIIRAWTRKQEPSKTEYMRVESLTERERGVLKLLAEGHTNKEVAKLLHISSKTVETHRSRIMEKLALDNFAALVKYAIKEKIIEI